MANAPHHGTLEVTSPSLARSAPPFTRQQGGVTLVVVDGPDVDSHLEVDDNEVVVGAGEDAALRLTDATISRRHFRVSARGAGLEIVDLESKNGCWIGASRIHHAVLELGAVFRAGNTSFKVLPTEQVVDPVESSSEGFGALCGESSAMRKLFSLLEQLAASDVSVLIEGETGVGKELVAEELHRRSDRNGALVVFDCGAVPRELVESTLFGHKRGSFTGATSDQKGLFDQADGGTIFLDEIGELEIGLQPALLRALDRGAIRPVGAGTYHNVSVRVISATHRNLADRIGSGEFREDLYYRLAVVRLAVPPLRDRREDIPLLVRHFLTAAGRPELELTQDGLDALVAHSWPGNVRELRNTVERGIALSKGGKLAVDVSRPSTSSPAPAQRSEAQRRPFREAKADAVTDFEKSYLTELMDEHATVTEAAHAAGMDRKHLRTLLKRHDVQ